MKANISIIVPIYKGQKYIPYWLDIVEKNAAYLKVLSLQCELILVNDCPEERIAVNNPNDQGFSLKVLNSHVNRGIHGARVYGLEQAEGDWVVFLDQDDKITEDYLIRQKERIGNADGVICNGYMKHLCNNIRNLIYVDNEAQEIARDLSYYLTTWNPIVSPGQVMLKKNAIPDFWRRHILKKNGADDYFLWIAMLKEGKNFALNTDKLYVHIGHERNVSSNTSAIARSVYEMDSILKENDLLSNKEKETLKKRKVWEPDRSRSVEIITVYDYWLYLEHRNLHVSDYLCAHKYYKIGIYGMSLLGNRLYDLLTDSNVETIFAIDRRAKRIACKIPTFCLEDTQVENYVKQVDIIIVTVAIGFESIHEKLENKYGVTVLSLKNILVDMIERTDRDN